MKELPKTYNPKEVEEKWLNTWLKEKLFKSESNSKKESFSIALPPPNVTGSLHMGHAFSNTIQDVLIRFNKMSGKNVLWQGGTDHAGIATQVLIEKDLSKKEKKRKEDIGRDEFLKRVWEWKEKHGNEIINQMKKLGCMLDYDRLDFTMNEHYSKAVKKVFVELYKKKLIYRGKRIVNWCPKCLTSISDLEVETEATKGKLFHILYPFNINDPSKGGLTVATTRPETMFGDIAVAVNPNDGRYKKLIGQKVCLPFLNKEIPIIGDEAIELDFGTGCLKVTPAHDLVDYEIYERNKHLGSFPEIMSLRGKIQDNENLGIPKDVVGEDRFKARELTVQKLEDLGLLKQTDEYNQPSAKHDRCGTVIEPYLSEQWYVKMKPLAEPAIKVVEDGKIQFTPERYKDHYLNWLRNIRDWCISRQLWWGHQIPVWYRKGTNEIYVGEEPPKDIENYTQDPDVLDTWFSSALWPFVTLGWPEETSYLKAFYPTSALATAREIINLWVSRMVFMGLEFAGSIPYKEVLIHPVIQTPDGKRMSKSKGNAIDPLEMIDKYGADANRFWYFTVGITGNQDVRFPGRKNKDGSWESDTLEQYRRFANKLWNAVRFVMQNLEEGRKYEYDLSKLDRKKLTTSDLWILDRYTRLLNSEALELAFKKYHFTHFADQFYKFTWNEFCDWYIELAKGQLNNPELRAQTRQILYYIVNGLIRALHPMMPFITEEIWQTLPHKNKTSFLCLEDYPTGDNSFLDKKAGESLGHVIETIENIRNLRQTVNIPWSKEIEVRLFTKDELERIALESYTQTIKSFTKASVKILTDFKPIKPSTGILVKNTRILIPLSGLVDLDNMLNALNKKKNQYEKDKENQKTKLNNTNFMSNAPQDKIEEVKQRIVDFDNQIKAIDEQIELLK